MTSSFSDEGLYDLLAEQRTLAAVMDVPAAVEDVCDIIGPEDFYRVLHQVLFTAMVRLALAGEPVDMVSLDRELAAEPDFRYDAGPTRDYLHDLQHMAGTVLGVQAGYYARIVWERAVARRIDTAGARLQQLARTPGVDVAGVTAQALAYMEGCADAAARPGTLAVSLDAFMSQHAEYREPVVPGLLHRQDRVVLVAPEGSGKSHLAYQVAFSKAAGVNPFTHQPIPPGRVTIVDLENPQDNLQDRFGLFEAVARQYPGWDRANIQVYSRPGGVDLLDPAAAWAVTESLRRFRPELVVAGPIYKMFDEQEENRHRHAAISRYFDRLRERLGVAVWLEAHAPITKVKGQRDMRPEGWGGWSKWPEFGVALLPAKKRGDGTVEFGWFRPPRIRGRVWPVELTPDRMPGDRWPWTATFAPGSFDTPLAGAGV